MAKTYSATKKQIQFISELGKKCSLIIMDEAHKAIADTYQLILDSLDCLGAAPTKMLGLTATPGRSWSDIAADEELADFFYSQKVGLEIPSYDGPIEYLTSEGYLAEVQFRELFHGGGLNLDEQDLQRVRESFDIPSDLLTRLANDHQRNLRIIESVQSLVENHNRIILFATSVEHSKMIATTLQASGIWAASITAETNARVRAGYIDEFKACSSDPQVLCNYGVLTTGFDAPATSCAVIARPTLSLVLYSQMVGRAIRGPRVGGNPRAEVVTVVDKELPGFADLAEAFHNWEDVWKDDR